MPTSSGSVGLEVESPSCPPTGPILQPEAVPSAEDGATRLARRVERTTGGVLLGSRLRNRPNDGPSGPRSGNLAVATIQLSSMIGGQGNGVTTRQRLRERAAAAGDGGAGLDEREGVATRGAEGGGGVTAVMLSDGQDALNGQARATRGRRKAEGCQGEGVTLRTRAKRQRQGEGSSASVRNQANSEAGEQEEKTSDSQGRSEGTLHGGGLGTAVGAEAADDATSARDVAGVPADAAINSTIGSRVAETGGGGGGNGEIRGSGVISEHGGAVRGDGEGEMVRAGDHGEAARGLEGRTPAAATAAAAPAALIAGGEGGTGDDAARIAQVTGNTTLLGVCSGAASGVFRCRMGANTDLQMQLS